MIIPRKPAEHPFVQAFRSLPVPRHESACLTALVGDVTAPLLLLCEHPTPAELGADMPFSDSAARSYWAILDQAGFEADDFLIVPYSRFGAKPNKASTVDMLPFLQEHLPPTVRCVVCMGMPAFGFTFAGGRKTHAQTILGNPMYLPKLRTLPVYVLPGTELLLEVSSADYRLRIKALERAEALYNLTLNLRKFCQTKLGLFSEEQT